MSLKGLACILAVSLSCISLCYLAVLPPAGGEVAGSPSTEAEKGHVDVPSTAYGHGEQWQKRRYPLLTLERQVRE